MVNTEQFFSRLVSSGQLYLAVNITNKVASILFSAYTVGTPVGKIRISTCFRARCINKGNGSFLFMAMMTIAYYSLERHLVQT
jgi:hypothetical protein